MQSGRALLLIADIGGYTEFMRSHRMSLAHAEVTTARLLETVIDAAHGFDLIEVEGDAAFLARQADALEGDATVVATTKAVVSMHRAFHIERRYVATNLCPCDGCAQADNLKLKFVAHVGEVAAQTVKKRQTLVGIDVIHVHRLLKNPVRVPEYVLLSEELYRTGDTALSDPVHEVSQDLDGIGPVRGYFVDVEDLVAGLPPPPDPSLSAASVERLASPAGAFRTCWACGTGVAQLPHAELGEAIEFVKPHRPRLSPERSDSPVSASLGQGRRANGLRVCRSVATMSRWITSRNTRETASSELKSCRNGSAGRTSRRTRSRVIAVIGDGRPSMRPS